MIYSFDNFELDLAAVELRRHGKPIDLEPQVFALLALLVANHDRMLSKDEVIEKVWDGRVVSDSAVSSRIKSARQALGDDGATQRFIKTVHGQGYRFAVTPRAAMKVSATAQYHEPPSPSLSNMVQHLDRMTRPSLAVLPFRFLAGDARYAALASALPDELIADLARLRWLLVTARGSSFRVATDTPDFKEIGRILSVRYCLTGSIEISDARLLVIVELVDTLDTSVVWAERYSGSIDDVHAIREQIRGHVLTALEIRIPLHEASLARRVPVENLDAWSAYHLGLQHLYRFNRLDNNAAVELFTRAVTLDPSFARAHAGLSFVHFQSAFMHYAQEIPTSIDNARRCADRALELDALDRFVNFTMGRTFWLQGDLDTSLTWLQRATDISPHYAQGIYGRAWAEALSGRSTESLEHVDLAMRLSPLDPLHYAMLSTRALTHISLNEDVQAVHWAERGARSPGAHVLIAAIAGIANALAGDDTRAKFWANNVVARNDQLTSEDFFRAFPMQPPAMRSRVAGALKRLGFK